jgi:uncharacterized protein YndB with AHSA1/START domain
MLVDRADSATSERTAVVRRTMPAPIQRVFDAWLDPISFSTWMVPPGIRVSHAQTDARVGGAYELMMHGEGNALIHSGVYREIDRPKRLVFTWISAGTHFRESVVAVELEANGASTEVSVSHTLLPDAASEASHTEGWTAVLGKLEALMARSPT